ncbi:hypothetical protein SSS_09581 [Sarcoptes scabiei]|nr:hypothetical protein SSS_09581 [Sarcoptes scabiei]
MNHCYLQLWKFHNQLQLLIYRVRGIRIPWISKVWALANYRRLKNGSDKNIFVNGCLTPKPILIWSWNHGEWLSLQLYDGFGISSWPTINISISICSLSYPVYLFV